MVFISRHESRLQRAHDRAYRTPRETQRTRKASEPEPPKPIKPDEPGQLQKNDKTNPSVPPSIQLALSRRFSTPIPEFNVMEVLSKPYHLSAAWGQAFGPAAALSGGVPTL